MKRKSIKFSLAATVLLLTLIFNPSSMRAQGGLTPPGAPASTMITLNQIEPRTPVDAINTPGETGIQFLITQPGSYYLTSNINVGAAEDGIYIEANDVTLDLNGFVLAGTDSAYGIVAIGEDIVIRNGAVLGWLDGVTTDDRCELDRLRAYGCVDAGFLLGNDCAVKNSVAITNGYGVLTGDRCEMADCLAISNLIDGIRGGADCMAGGCRSVGNAHNGFTFDDDFNISKCSAILNLGDGFDLGNNGFICQCVANSNYDGISVEARCTVTECVADTNEDIGITSNGDSVLTDNQASANAYGGIYTYAGGNRIEHNQTRDNLIVGIQPLTGDIVVRNVSVNNHFNYNPATGPNIAPVQTPAAATSPWANF